MQRIVPTGPHNPNGHTEAEILDALHGVSGSRMLTFRYDLLDSDNTYLQALDGLVEQGKVSQDWLADIKRKATFTIRDTGVINYLSDRIKPWVRLHLPPYGTDDWVEWPQGVFLLSSPKRSDDAAGTVTRQVDAYDQLQVLLDDKVSVRYTVAAGTVYTTEVATLLSSFTSNITPSAATVPADLEWDPGTAKLKIINELLGAVNYESLSFDENGVALVRPYVSPAKRAAEHTYADDQIGVIVPGVDQMLDLFGVANQWTLVVSEPDQDPIVSTYTNNDPGSPLSTVNRGRTIVDFRDQQQAADQATLDELAKRLAFEASQVYEILEFTSALMPIHSGNDVLRFEYSQLAVAAKYAEQSWEMQLAAGITMKHRIRRVVDVNKYSLLSPDLGTVTLVKTAQGVDVYSGDDWVATYTHGCRTVALAGPSSREFTEQKAVVTDEFDRILTGEWGVSPGAGTWGNYGGSDADYSVSSGVGSIACPTTNTSRYVRLNDIVGVADVTCKVKIDSTPVGASNSISLILGWSNTSNHYRFRLLISTAGALTAAITKYVSGSETTLASSTSVGSGYTGGDWWHIRATSDGAGNLAMTAWADGDSEPSPQRTADDTTFLTGKVGIRGFASTGCTSDPTFSVDDFAVDAEWPDPPSVTHDTWVRLLDAPFQPDDTPDLAWLTEAIADGSNDLLDEAMAYITGGASNADYGPLYAPGRSWDVSHADDGTRQEGSDWNDYLGVDGEYPDLATPTTDSPETYQLGCLDCSGYVRMLYGHILGIPMCLSDSADFNGTNLPRVSGEIATYGPGTIIASAPDVAPSTSKVLPGDILCWDADTTNPEETEGQVDHVGIYLGTDADGQQRFISSRKVANGPTLADLGGPSVIGDSAGDNLYSRQLRAIRRL